MDVDPTAIQLIRKDDTGYVLTPEGEAFLQGIDEPIAVLGIAGTYRSGKSTLMNFLSESKAFAMGNTVQACTLGIYALNRVLRLPDGRACILLDSEGLDSTTADASHDATVLGLTILMSSTFVLNATGAVSESALANLSLITNLTKQLQESTKQDVAAHFPAFHWCSRDFALQLVDEQGTSITEDQYFASALTLTGNPRKDAVRQTLHTAFPSRSFSGIVRPVAEESDLTGGNLLECPNLRPEFIQQLNAFRSKLFAGIRTKRVNGLEITGATFAHLVQSYVDGLNGGGGIKIDGAWESLCRLRNGDALRKATKYFEAAVKGIVLPVERTALTPRLFYIRGAALDQYKQGRYAAENDQFETDLCDFMDGRIESTTRQNQKLVDSKMEVLLTKFVAPLRAKVDARTYTTASAFQADYDSGLQHFTASLSELFGSTKAAKQHVHCWFVATKDVVLASISTVVSHTQERVDALNDELSTLKATQGRETENRKALVLEHQKCVAEVAELRDSQRELLASVAAAEAAAKEAASAHDAVVAELRAEVDAERVAAAAATATWQAGILTRVEEANATVSKLNLEKDDLLAEKAALVAAAAKAAEDNAATQKRLRRFNELVAASVQKDMEVEQLKKEVKKCALIAEEGQEAADLQRQQQQDGLATAALSLQAANDRHGRALRDAATKHDQALLDRTRERDTAAAACAAVSEEASQAKAAVAALQAEQAAASLQLAELERKGLALQQALTQRDVALQESKHELEATKGRFELAATQLRAAKHTETERLQKTLAEMDFRVSAAESTATMAQGKVLSVTKDFATRFEVLDADLSKKRKRVDVLEDAADASRALVAEHPLLKSRCEQAEANLEALETEHRAAKRRLASIEGECTAKITRLEIQLSMQQSA